jgi:endonuclease YncB( thermonuclease family)
MRPLQRTLTAALALSILDIFMTVSSVAAEPAATPVYRVDHVVDGDTIALRNGQRVRLVQIDTPEVFFGAECYGRAASRRGRGTSQSALALIEPQDYAPT